MSRVARSINWTGHETTFLPHNPVLDEFPLHVQCRRTAETKTVILEFCRRVPPVLKPEPFVHVLNVKSTSYIDCE